MFSKTNPKIDSANVASGKKLPNETHMDEIGDRILSGEFTNFTYHVTGNPNLTVHFFARHDDVTAFLYPKGNLFETPIGDANPADYINLGNYDDALDAGAHGARFFITADDEVTPQWDILEAALALPPSLNRELERSDFGRELIQEQAELAVNEVIFNIHQRHDTISAPKRFMNWIRGREHKPKFNAINDYGLTVTHVFVRDFLGLRLPEKRSWIFKIIQFGLQVFVRKQVRGKGLGGAANECYFWIGIMFYQLFINPGNKNKLAVKASVWVANLYKREILRSYKNPVQGSLLERLKKIELIARESPGEIFKNNPPHMKDDFDKYYHKKVVDIIMEVAGSFQFLTGSAFSKMLESIENWQADHPDQEMDRDQVLLKFIDDLNDHPRAMIDECLRHNTPTRFMYRKAKKTFTPKGHGGLVIQEGDIICLLTKQAMLDRSAFDAGDAEAKCPYLNTQFLRGETAEKYQDQYLTFGSPDQLPPDDYSHQRPFKPHHPCFGQYWARAILQTMFNGLAQFKNVRITELQPGKKRKFDEFNLSYDVPQTTHNFVTVLSSPVDGKFPKDSPEKLIAQAPGTWRQDNPTAALDFASVLRNCKDLHFMSAHIIRGVDESEPDYLLLELSIDGGLGNALDQLTENFGEEFRGLYVQLGLMDKDATTKTLRKRLFDDAGELQQSSWPHLLSRKGLNGLPFCGSPGLSADRILTEAKLASFISARLRDPKNLDEELSGLELMRELRTELFNHGLSKSSCPQSYIDMRWIFGGSTAPSFADCSEDGWNQSGRGMMDYIKTGIGLVPPVLFLPLIVVFLAMVVLAENLFGVPPGLADPAVYSAFPIELWRDNPELGVYISARTLLIYTFVALVLGSIISRLMRRFNILPRARSGEFIVSSLIFSVIMIIAAVKGLWGLSPQESGLIFGDDPRPFLGAVIGIPAVLSALVYLRDDAAKLIDPAQMRAKAFALLGTLVLAITALGIHVKLFSLGGDHVGFSVANRFTDATMFDLIFYPLIWGGMMMLTVQCYRYSYARNTPDLASKKTVGVLVLVAAIAFIGAFFPAAVIATDEPGYTSLLFRKIGYLAAGIPLTIGATAIIALALFGKLSRSEKNNRPHDSAPNAKNVKAIMEKENGAPGAADIAPGQIQNHMISVQQLLPSAFRQRFLLPVSFQAIKRMLITGIIRPGFLGNVGTVHYARWVHLPKTRNYVFLSNYDGSWESYLEDFIAKVWQGVNAAWSHCVGFPQAKNIFFKGVQDGDRFKKWARGSMRPTPFWYSAYPDLSLEAIRRNALIRDGLVRARTSDEIEAWLRLFGAMTRQSHALQSDQIQNIVFGGSPHLPFGACIILEIKKSKNTHGLEEGTYDPEKVREAFREFIHNIKDQISFGQGKPSKRALYIAFGRAGLEALDHENVLLHDRPWIGDQSAPDIPAADGFSVPFQIGMHDVSRKALLGDPDALAWGEKGNILAAVIVHAIDQGTFDGIANSIDRYVADSSVLSTFTIPFQTDGDKFQHREPFGFTDGVSNPIIQGTRNSTDQQGSIHMVEPGEFILGYKDNRGYFPPSPQVPSEEDPARILPVLPADQLLQYPKFASAKTPHLRDLGRNGSYLVIRQLEQDVKGFHAATKTIASALSGVTEAQLAETVVDEPSKASSKTTKASYEKVVKKAKKEHLKNVQNIIEAKLIGRWQDGSSLVNRPVDINDITNDKVDLPDTRPVPLSRDALRAKNEFLFGRDDPQGHACPYGAHIRRSNPRDSLDPNNSKSEIEVANRHRLLRRGRTYQDKDGKEGTLFICLNGDLDRQFEFVQQTWMLGPDFHGLKGEFDPLSNRASQGFTVQCPGQAAYFGAEKVGDTEGRNRLTQFVTLKGGGYFFMPGKAALEYLCFLGDGGKGH